MNKKYPKSDLPEYYLSKVNIELSANKTSFSTAFNYLKSANRFSNRLPEKYCTWKLEVQNKMAQYILEKHDSTKILRKIKSALNFYTKTYNDTLVIYAFYHPELIKYIADTNDVIPNVDSLRKVLLTFAKNLVGISYNYAGETPSTGFDCSGFTLYVYKHIGIDLPHNAQLQSLFEGKNVSLEEAQPGDLIFFGYRGEKSHYTSHAGIFFSENPNESKVIHCVTGGVKIDGNNTSWDLYWKDRVLFVKRLAVFDN
ncbi:MAG: C40 family peptidase [Bacteroidales bacterium]|nr:C40 family peptidase [Bacteroidales bacterium]